jgi:hypothetical protein
MLFIQSAIKYFSNHFSPINISFIIFLLIKSPISLMKQQSSYEYLFNLFLSQELLMYLEHFTEDSIDACNLIQ